ncbi:androgen-dependent TFPI-regulating protein-like [Pectinophora gossypiella]|uniref:androgen-dependent TFPI-regulating protein-like n=1 Tax=Pectinophora gossypiella TaxID=13191 RepID=UPI00214EA304|nr:androgen-dependent TFPI-regulating protein-like [Pectinophora gossypiella]
MSSKLIYLRILGYLVTIIMHVTNIVSMSLILHTKEARELFKDPTIKFFNANQARYFTCWTFFLQIVYAIAGLWCDCLALKNADNKGYKLPKYLKGFRDTLFAGVQWPSTLLVASVFWTLFTLDRNLMFPAILDQVLTRTSNHIIHTAIIPVVLWEIVFQPRCAPASHFRNLAHLTFHSLLYFSVLFYTYYVDGTWIYPVFKRIEGTIYLPLFIILLYVLLLFYYFIQWPITRFIHGNLEKSKRKIR